MNLKLATKPWKKPFFEERKIIINVSTLNSCFFKSFILSLYQSEDFFSSSVFIFYIYLVVWIFEKKITEKILKTDQKKIFLLLLLLCNSSYVQHKSVLLNKEQFRENLLILVVFLRTIPWYNGKVIIDVSIFNSLFFHTLYTFFIPIRRFSFLFFMKKLCSLILCGILYYIILYVTTLIKL